MTRFAVAALAGRRIDAPQARVQRFPLRSIPNVRNGIRRILIAERIELLISSAACGADLLGLEQASLLSIRSRIVLPYDILTFRRTSVVDRPGNWGPLFDRMISLAQANGELVVLNASREANAFSAANNTVVAQAISENATSTSAIAVWEGHRRGWDDATAEFVDLASTAGMKLLTVPTC